MSNLNLYKFKKFVKVKDNYKLLYLHRPVANLGSYYAARKVYNNLPLKIKCLSTNSEQFKVVVNFL